MKHKPLLATGLYHWVFDATNVPKSVTNNKNLLTRALSRLAHMCKMSIVAGPLAVGGIPSNPGFTAVCIVDFSHISIHTFSNPREVCVDIFSCKEFDPGPIHKYLLKTFAASKEQSIFCDVKYPHEYRRKSLPFQHRISEPRRYARLRKKKK